MADKVFGTSSLILGTDPSNLEKGLTDSGVKITTWVKSMNAAVSASGPVGLVLAGIGAIKTVFDGALSLTAGFAGKLNETFDEVRQQSRQALSVGLTGESFSRLLAGTKVESEQLVGSLEKMSHNISDFGQGSLQATATFQKLGLSTKELSGTAAEQFSTIANRIHDLVNPADQAAAAMRVFGKQGVELLPAIRGGLDGAIQKAEQMGLVLGQGNVEAMEKVSKTWQDVSKIGKGIWLEFASAVVPIFQSAATVVMEVWEGVAPVFRKGAEIVGWFSRMVSAVFEELKAIAIPIFQKLATLFGVDLQFSVSTLTDKLEEFFRVGAQQTGKLLRLFRDLAVFLVADVAPVFLNLGVSVLALFKNISPAVVAVENLFIDLANVINSSMQKTLVFLATKFEEFTRWIAEKLKAAAAVDPTGAIGLAAKVFDKMADGQERMKNTFKDMSLEIEHLNPDDAIKGFDEWQDKLLDMKDQLPGIADALKDLKINPDDIDRAVDHVLDRVHRQTEASATDMANQFGEVADKAKDKFATAANSGSVEASKIIYQATYGGGGKDDQAGLLKEGNKNSNKANQHLEDIAGLLRNQAQFGPQLGGI